MLHYNEASATTGVSRSIRRTKPFWQTEQEKQQKLAMTDFPNVTSTEIPGDSGAESPDETSAAAATTGVSRSIRRTKPFWQTKQEKQHKRAMTDVPNVTSTEIPRDSGAESPDDASADGSGVASVDSPDATHADSLGVASPTGVDGSPPALQRMEEEMLDLLAMSSRSSRQAEPQSPGGHQEAKPTWPFSCRSGYVQQGRPGTVVVPPPEVAVGVDASPLTPSRSYRDSAPRGHRRRTRCS